MRKDLSAILPDGSTFEFWEKDPEWTRELFVSNTDPVLGSFLQCIEKS